MQTVKLRQQGGAMIVTIPRELVNGLGWSIGAELAVEKKGETVSFTPTKPRPRGRHTVAQLLSQIDSAEIDELNQSVEGWGGDKQGNEVW